MQPMRDWSKDDEYFAANMRLRREELGWKQADLAHRLKAAGMSHMHQTTVSRIEVGERAPRVSEARAIADVLETSVWRLLQPPESVAVGDAILRDTVDLESAHQSVTSSLRDLWLSRLTLERRLEETADSVADDPFYAIHLDALKRRARLALEMLTESTAIGDRPAPNGEETIDRYFAELRSADGEHPEAE